jgi:hypothetical protein
VKAGVVQEHLRRWKQEYGVGSVLHVTGPHEPLEPADLVMVHDALAQAGDWRAYLRKLAGLARKVLVLLAPNPQSVLGWGREASLGSTTTLAPVLWELGRVREHTYVDVPWGLDRAPASVLVRAARSHAFVVDVRPRTRQARRRMLRTT